jgi:hypothetical protein
MNLEEFLFTLATVFFTTSFIVWLRVLVYDIAKGTKTDKSTAEHLKLYKNDRD